MTQVLDAPLRRCRPSEDVVSLSECRDNLSRDIETSRREFAEGKGIPHEQVMRETRAMLARWVEEDKRKAENDTTWS